MNEQQLAAVRLALEALLINCGGNTEGIGKEAITALQSIIDQDALYKMAEDAVTIGLSYNDWPKIGCVNHDCDQCKAVQEPVAVVSGYYGGQCVILPTNPARLFQSGTAFYTTPPSQPVAHPVIAGALFDFMGWLTSRKETLVLSSTNNASPAVEAITEFAKMRGLSLDGARVQDWQDNTTPPAAQKPLTDVKSWVDLSDEEIDALAELHGLEYMSYAPFVKDLKQRLKEKNHG